MNHIYLAGPFFNDPQIETISTLEKILERSGVPYYSPRQHGVLSPATSSDEERANIFTDNENAIIEASLVLAVTEYALPDGETLALVKRIPVPYETEIKMPDQGTVYETGFARGLKTPVIGFHRLDNPKESLNVMLTEGFEGFLHSFVDVEEFIYLLKLVDRKSKPEFQMEKFLADQLRVGVLKKWKGQVR